MLAPQLHGRLLLNGLNATTALSATHRCQGGGGSRCSRNGASETARPPWLPYPALLPPLTCPPTNQPTCSSAPCMQHGGVCQEHMMAQAVSLHGLQQRFCQQVGRAALPRAVGSIAPVHAPPPRPECQVTLWWQPGDY